MIEYISGTLYEARADYLVIDNGGIAYKVYISEKFFRSLPSLGTVLKVYTHLVHRDNCMELYGFARVYDRSIFQELIRVSGVGMKLSMRVQSSFTSEEIVSYVVNKDVKVLRGVSGLGKRVADKIVLELSERFKGLYFSVQEEGLGLSGDYSVVVFDALRSLGYKDSEIRDAFNSLNFGSGVVVEDMVRDILRWFSSR